MTDLRDRLTTPSISALFANSRLTRRALIIVEGKDDIQFYSRLGNSIDKKLKIYSIENIEGYSEGSDQIIKLTENFQNKLLEEEINSKYFLSIIDNDVRQFRDEEIHLKGLFKLKYYSFESHYLTTENLKTLIIDLTQVEHSLIEPDFLEDTKTEIQDKITNDLYLPSLEALKNALEHDYDNVIGYKMSAGSFLKNRSLLDQLESKKEILFKLERDLGLQKNFEQVRYIAKGKWILTSFAKHTSSTIYNLKDKCRDSHINQCQYCSSGNTEKCLYKPTIKPQEGAFIEMIKNLIDKRELEYIINRLSELH